MTKEEARRTVGSVFVNGARVALELSGATLLPKAVNEIIPVGC